LQNTRVRPVRIPKPDSFPSQASRALAGVARALGRGQRATGADRVTGSVAAGSR
jgi:hypothetical protein